MRTQAGLSHATRRNVAELTAVAAAGLAPMFDPETQLFCFRLRLTPEGLAGEGSSPRYGAMSLLGLQRWEAAGGRSPVETGPAVDALLTSHAWADNMGDAGLLLWLAAKAAPERLPGLCSSLRLESALSRFQDARERRTMELAWFLTGLSYAAMTAPARRSEFRSLAEGAFELLRCNQGRHGIFGHQAARGSVAGVLRGRIGSFADQVYPIYALTRFAVAFEAPAALEMARTCADAICDLQGSRGQWWWHYSATSGKVFQQYPVYSVHQHGMAPMALLALGEAAGRDYSESVSKGLAWLHADNEIGLNMVDTASRIIWRCVYLKGWGRRLREAAHLLSPAGAAGFSTGLAVRFECRPYELGWLLYALAGMDSE